MVNDLKEIKNGILNSYGIGNKLVGLLYIRWPKKGPTERYYLKC